MTAGSRLGSGKSATCGRHLATSHIVVARGAAILCIDSPHFARLMSDSARFLQDQDDLMCSNSGYPQLTTEQMSQLLSSIQQSQPGLLQQVPQINSVTALPPPGMAPAGMLGSLSSMPVQQSLIDRSICAQSRQTGPASSKDDSEQRKSSRQVYP